MCRRISIMPTSVITKRKKKRSLDGADVTVGAAKKRKRSHPKPTTIEEVESVGGTGNPEHAQILGSVTGKLSKLPLGRGEGEGTQDQDSTKLEEEQKGRSGGGEVEGKEEEASKLAAAEYLLLWEQNRKKWAFRKKTQYWLLQNMYEKKKVWCVF